MKGFIQLYTGNGKGKTTAALGQALRAAGAGMKTFIAQFVKGMPYGELEVIQNYLPGIVVKQYGRGCFIINGPTEEDIRAAQAGLFEVSSIIADGAYDLIVLDEICIALHFNLLSLEYLLSVLRSKPAGTEIILTGRYAPAELIELADLVTEMKEVKHYYQSGVEARKGIEY